MPDDPSPPPPMRGAPVAGLGGVYAGPVEEGEKVLRPLRQYGPPLVDKFAPTPYNDAQRMAEFLWPPGLHSYWKSSYLKALDDEAVEIVVDRFAHCPVTAYRNRPGALWRQCLEPRARIGDRVR